MNWVKRYHLRQFIQSSIWILPVLGMVTGWMLVILPPERTALLRDEITLLHHSVERSFPEPKDQARADIGDLQGVGGKHSEQSSTGAGVGTRVT